MTKRKIEGNGGSIIRHQQHFMSARISMTFHKLWNNAFKAKKPLSGGFDG